MVSTRWMWSAGHAPVGETFALKVVLLLRVVLLTSCRRGAVMTGGTLYYGEAVDVASFGHSGVFALMCACLVSSRAATKLSVW
jgi:hypothetical protein